MATTKVEFNDKDACETEAEVSGFFWLLREDKEDFKNEFEALIDKYSI